MELRDLDNVDAFQKKPHKYHRHSPKMYASPGHRYSQRSSYYGGSSSSNQSQSYSPTKYGNYTSSASSYDDQQQSQHAQNGRHHQGQYYSPPLKAQGYPQRNNGGFSDYYNNNQSAHYYHHHQDGTTYFPSSSSTASSSQDGYYGDELDDFDDYRSAFSLRADADPEMTTVPTVPTPIALSIYEHGKTPSGRVLVTSGNQTVELFSCVANAPSRGVFVADISALPTSKPPHHHLPTQSPLLRVDSPRPVVVNVI